VRVRILAWARESGGAERQLANLAGGLTRRGHEVTVVVFFPNPALVARLRREGSCVEELDVRGRADVPGWLGRYLLRSARRGDDVVYGFLLVPNLLTVLLRLFAPELRVVWGVRMSEPRAFAYNALTHPLERLARRLAGAADVVIANSRAGKRDLLALGYDPERVRVVDNGIDTVAFRPDPAARRRLRAAWGVSEGERLVGLVGRLDPKKDHETFLHAAALARARHPELRFVCVGDGPEERRRRLAELDRELTGGSVRWESAREDVAGVYSALDVLTLTSAFGEGFPNVLAEALACGVPTVTTDVGDAARVVGEHGVVVPRRDPAALAAGWREALEFDRDVLPRLVRDRIVREFGVDRMVEQTEGLLECVVSCPR
jgi:glycosyltransferase involved in cell wall biosynthesis